MKHILLLCCVAVLTNLSNAQEHVVRGKVSDETAGIIGATIAELDENDRIINGTITNFDGDYTIQVSSPNATL